MGPLFPALPDALDSLDRDALDALEAEHVSALSLIREQNADFLGDLTAVQIIDQATIGKAQLQQVRDAQAALAAAEQTFVDTLNDLTADVVPAVEEPVADLAVVETEIEEPAVEETVEEPIVASAPVLRRPPSPSVERLPLPQESPRGAVLTASIASEGVRPGDALDRVGMAKLVKQTAIRLGKPQKHERGTEERTLLASATYQFPEDRILTNDFEANAAKIHALKNTDGQSLVASGGLCAPLTPIYTIPQFAVMDRPVRDMLPSFFADRGGVNVPVPTTLASAADAITVITEAEDAMGGTFATKSCLSQTCLSYVETAVTIISHCREYGNLNARAWPESIAFENEITMAEHARVSDGYLLSRIKEQSLQVTAANVYSTTYDLIYAITRAVSALRYRLRTGDNVRFRTMLPSWVPDMMIADVAATPFERFINRERATQILRNAGVEPGYYFDDLFPIAGVSAGVSQGFPDEVTGTTLDSFPTAVQFPIFPEGAFIHVDGGVLELGLVRDSTLNSTNDFQYFGESFENVARLGPVQSALWISATVCPSGEFPSLTTALSCS